MLFSLDYRDTPTGEVASRTEKTNHMPPPARTPNVLQDLDDDGLPREELKPHSRDKLFLLGYYFQVFTKSMHRKFPQLVYVDLFAGSGRGQFGKNDIMEGSALIAVRTDPPFTKLILCEQDEDSFNALRVRVDREFKDREIKLVPGDCNERRSEIRAEIPRFSTSTGGLTVCVVDPYNLGIEFETLRAFGDLRVDFIVLIADQMAGGRIADVLLTPGDSKVEKFLADPDWRDKWALAQAKNVPLRTFLLREFTERMKAEGFRDGGAQNFKVQGKGVNLYHLALFSKSKLAVEFWQTTLKRAPAQMGMF